MDEVILSNDSVSRLMAQAAIHHGSSKLFNQMLSSADGENLYEIKTKPHWNTYRDAAMELFNMGATLISEERGKETFMTVSKYSLLTCLYTLEQKKIIIKTK